MKFFSAAVLLLSFGHVSSFSITTPSSTSTCRGSPLFMGRAAAVREKTKSKTDAKKAKVNALYGKKIIMAVKQGGPDPDANRALGELIKQAKTNSVPVDVSFVSIFLRSSLAVPSKVITHMFIAGIEYYPSHQKGFGSKYCQLFRIYLRGLWIWRCLHGNQRSYG